MIELERKFDAIPVLKEYYKVSQNFGDIYNAKRDPIDDNWIHFNENLADSIVKIYSYFICLDNKTVDGIADKDQKKKISRFLSFYYDFIVSKPSNTIFTEMQKRSELDLFPLNSYSISLQAKKLFLYKNSLKTVGNLTEDIDYNIAFQYLFHKVFAYYDFIFSGDEGVFSKFCYDKDLFEYTKTYFDVNEDGINIRELMNNSVAEVVKKTLDYEEQNSRVKNHFLWNFFPSSKDKEYGKEGSKEEETLDHKKIFKEFVNRQKKSGDPKRFEIFTYILANKLWKIDKIYQSSLEIIGNEEGIQVKEEYEKKSKQYIEDYLSVVQEYYQGSIQEFRLYGKIYTLDKEFIGEYVLQELLEDIDEAPLNNVEISAGGPGLFVDVDKKNLPPSVDEIINTYAIDNKEHEKFKFYRILEKATAAEIAHVIDSMHLLIKEQFDQEEYGSLQYMGVLRSGSFLSHALNILKYYSNIKGEGSTQISESLLTHPYLTILPRNLFDRQEKNVIVVYIDEAIKSGYGITISHLYRKKILSRESHNPNIKDCAIVLANFIDYRNKINNRLDGLKCSVGDTETISENIKHYGLTNIERTEKKELECKKNTENTIKKNFTWKVFLKDIGVSSKDQTLSSVLYSYAEKNGRLDFTKVISNSFLLIMTCKYFAKKLRGIIRERQELNELNAIAMYAGSIEGKLLIDMTIFIYKVLYESEENTKKQLFEINGKGYGNKDNDICLFFDITYITGDTCNRTFKLDVKNKNIKDFNHKFVIYDPDDRDSIISLCSNPTNKKRKQ